MDYKQKYLKYKTKYFNLKNKNLKGGATTYNFFHLSELPNIDLTNIDLINVKDHILVPMNAYEFVDNTCEDIISTTGLVDCVAVCIFNPSIGRYFAHFLKFNEFDELFTNACEILGDNEPCLLDISFSEVCDLSSTKIETTLPIMFNLPDTVITILSQAEAFKVLSRLNQIKRKFNAFSGTFNIYLNTLEGKDESELRKFLSPLPRPEIELTIKQIIQKLSNKDEVHYKIFLFFNDGLVRCVREESDIKSDISSHLFYISTNSRRIASFHDNKRCISKYSFKKSMYYERKEEFTETLKFTNVTSDRKFPNTRNPYQINFNLIKNCKN
jgi:hypothetical protein